MQVNLWDQQSSSQNLGKMTTNICLVLHTVFEVVSHALFQWSSQPTKFDREAIVSILIF